MMTQLNPPPPHPPFSIEVGGGVMSERIGKFGTFLGKANIGPYGNSTLARFVVRRRHMLLTAVVVAPRPGQAAPTYICYVLWC
jgi:hypothetical protein